MMKNLKTFSNFLNEASSEESTNYMFFQNLRTIQNAVEEMLSIDPEHVDTLLSEGHGWALDHIATSKDDIEEVRDFVVNSIDSDLVDIDESKKSDTKLVDKIADLHVGDQVFQLGDWKTVEKIEGAEALLVDEKGAKSRIKSQDLQKNKLLVKDDSKVEVTWNTGKKETTRPVTGVKVDKKHTGKLQY